MMETGELDEDKIASKLDDINFIRRVKRDLRESAEDTKKWREEVRENYDFRAGNQYSEADRAKMTDQLMPLVTFNRCDVFVSAIVGLEALNKKEVKYVPRSVGPEKAGASELMTAAADYVNEDGYADMHHSHAFEDCVQNGVGVTSTRMDYETNPDGDLVIERLSPLNTYWDTRATQRNLVDRRWCANVELMPMREIQARWPDKVKDIGNPALLEPDNTEIVPADYDEQLKWMIAEANGRHGDSEKDGFVVRYQWYDLVDVYRVPVGEKLENLSKAQYQMLRQRMEEEMQQINPGMKMPVIRPIKQRKYYQAFVCGAAVLERAELSCDMFSILFITGKRDETNNQWYGIMRGIKSPQEYLNKLYSVILHIYNCNAKGGLLAEIEALEDPDKAQEDWARPDRIVYTRPGALVQGRIKERQSTTFPAGLDRLMQFAMDMFTHVSGANIEMLGLAEKVQPGVLEAQRKQAGMTILSWAFDAFSLYKKQHAKVLSAYIRKYISDDRLIRISGPDGYQFIPLIRDALADEYDFVVDEAVNAPDEKARTFNVLMQLMPIWQKAGTPVPPAVLDYMPLPASLVNEIKKQMQPDPMQAQMAQQSAQMQLAGQQAEVENTQADTEKKRVETAAKDAETKLKLINNDGGSRK